MRTQAFPGFVIALCAAIAGCAATPPVPGPLRVPADQALIKQLLEFPATIAGAAADGSRVVAEAIGSSPSLKPNSIPWLLLKARATAGNGLFAHVQFIQRINTAGGSVPATSCRREQAGQQLRAAYTADYLFYGARH